MARPKTGPSIYDLGAELKLSPGTISRALRNCPEVSAGTRAKVRDRAAALGFELRSPCPRRINIGAVLLGPPAGAEPLLSYATNVLAGMQDYATRANVTISLLQFDADAFDGRDVVRTLRNRGADAAVFFNALQGSRFYNQLNDQRFPYCNVMADDGGENRRLLTIDSRRDACRAVEYLLDLGHARIAVALHFPDNDTTAKRFLGYKDALSKARIPVDDGLVLAPSEAACRGSDEFDFGYHGVEVLLSRASPPTALVTMSCEAAIGALHALRQRGIAVPRKFSVLAHDDSRYAEFTSPPLSVIRVPNRRLGQTAAEWVHRLSLGEQLPAWPDEPWMHAELVVRESTGSPRPGRLPGHSPPNERQ
ncbi:MAG: hypothetical protein A3K19_14310 [Lentisphaerae bacterium RIFOXYB12_FULL_65_16]|nr:MAG: hypothetical protein A3K18_18355 [Lentisphaerae bacterium RIFOXYA12_64_32]OGV87396.1 MAG: hypothetical protein A3K19_14310 [Lentisphaerae bacterium RIFOXYB12_FULL_65_16]